MYKTRSDTVRDLSVYRCGYFRFDGTVTRTQIKSNLGLRSTLNGETFSLGLYGRRQGALPTSSVYSTVIRRGVRHVAEVPGRVTSYTHIFARMRTHTCTHTHSSKLIKKGNKL